MKVHPKQVFVLVAVVLYGGSLETPALQFDTRPNAYGIEFMFLGWLGPLFGQFDWYANLLLILGFKNGWQHRFLRAEVYSALSLLLMLQTIVRGCVAMDESGSCTPVSAYLVGYWLWIASAITLIFGSGANYVLSRGKL
jgi:hypothetical protein